MGLWTDSTPNDGRLQHHPRSSVRLGAPARSRYAGGRGPGPGRSRWRGRRPRRRTSRPSLQGLLRPASFAEGRCTMGQERTLRVTTRRTLVQDDPGGVGGRDGWRRAPGHRTALVLAPACRWHRPCQRVTTVAGADQEGCWDTPSTRGRSRSRTSAPRGSRTPPEVSSVPVSGRTRCHLCPSSCPGLSSCPGPGSVQCSRRVGVECNGLSRSVLTRCPRTKVAGCGLDLVSYETRSRSVPDDPFVRAFVVDGPDRCGRYLVPRSPGSEALRAQG